MTLVVSKKYEDKFSKVNTVRTLSQLDTEPIKENLKIIYPDLIFDDFDNKRMKKLFDDFADGYIRQHYYLTQRNSGSFGKSFYSLLFDLIAFVLLMICGILILSINLTEDIKLDITNIIVAIFSATVIDLLANVILSIRKELNIIDFYET